MEANDERSCHDVEWQNRMVLPFAWDDLESLLVAMVLAFVVDDTAAAAAAAAAVGSEYYYYVHCNHGESTAVAVAVAAGDLHIETLLAAWQKNQIEKKSHLLLEPFYREKWAQTSP